MWGWAWKGLQGIDLVISSIIYAGILIDEAVTDSRRSKGMYHL